MRRVDVVLATGPLSPVPFVQVLGGVAWSRTLLGLAQPVPLSSVLPAAGPSLD